MNLLGSRLRRVKLSKGFIIYIAECREGTYITGLTRNLRKTLRELNSDYPPTWYLKVHPDKKPVKIIWSECNSNFTVAFMKWRYLRTRHRKVREKIMATGVWPSGFVSRAFLKMKDNLIS